MANKSIRVGLHYHQTDDLPTALSNANQAGYQFIVTRLVHPRSGHFTPHCDLELTSNEWSTYVVGELTDHSLDEPSRVLSSSAAIDSEISYAMHLALPAVTSKCPTTSDGISNLARIVNSKLAAAGGCYQNLPQFWVEIPIQASEDRSRVWRSDLENDREYDKENGQDQEYKDNELNHGDKLNHQENDETCIDTWQRWNHFRRLLVPDKRVLIALEMSGDLPEEDEKLKRWAGEPVKVLVIPTSAFLTNKKGFPVLSRRHQVFVRMLIDTTARDVHFVIKGNRQDQDVTLFGQYIEHLITTQNPGDAVANFARGYEDYLQIPLQPLMDNLESCTYEVFEKDPIKYQQYGLAIHKALLDLKKLKNDDPINVMVVGAGRGPLVNKTLESAQQAGVFVDIVAVEKNPNAIVTLKYLQEHHWGGSDGFPWGQVDVASGDMREWKPDKEKLADLVVSELLGSFADNELSPECLDGVKRLAAPHAISIPTSYKSYFAPIQSQKLHTEAFHLREKDKPSFSALETSYVVHMSNVYVIDNPKPVFEFDHSKFGQPLPDGHTNARFTSITWKAKIDTVVHGLAGYFEAVLYGDVTLSTVPSRPTPMMFSWFPIFFPLIDPMLVEGGESVTVNVWRLVNSRQIWYEWATVAPIVGQIHNPNGRSYAIGLL